MGQNSLPDLLRRLRRRVLLIDGAAGAVWGLVAGVLWILVGVWLDLVLELSGGMRVAVLGTSVAVALVVFLRQTVAGMARGAAGWMARRLDEVAGTGGQILSGVDLVAATGYGYSADPALTSGLAQMAVRRATQLAQSVPHAAAVPARPVGRSAGSLAVLLAGAALAVLLMPRLAATEWRRFTDPFGDHVPFSTTTFMVEPGDTRVVYGSGLDIHAKVEGTAVDGLDLVLLPVAASDGDASRSTAASSSEEIVPMFPEEQGKWRASLANVTRATGYFVRARNARSDKYTIDVITVPQFAEVLFHVTPPAYTRQPAYDGPLPAGGLAGLPGTEVKVSVRSNRPLSGGTLTYTTKGTPVDVPLAPAGAGSDTVVGAFLISAGGRVEIRIVDEAGQPSTDAYSAPVTLLVDERPFVRLVEPRPMSYATPTAIIPVVVSAEDDYGLAKLQLFRNLNDSRYLPADLPVPNPPARQLYQVIPLPLDVYGLSPGDEIKLFARVEDNDPLVAEDAASASGSGKGAESSVVVIRIISHEQFEQLQQAREGLEMVQAKFQQASRRMEALAREVEELQKKLKDQPPDSQAAEETRKELAKLAERMQEEAEALKKLSQQKHPLDIDRELNQELKRLHKSVARLQKRTEALAAQPMLTNAELKQALDELEKELRGEREHLESEATEPLETLAAIAKLTQDESRFLSLYERQRDLADRLKSLKGKDQVDDPAIKARMRDLEEEQRRLHAELEQLLADIEEHADALPEDDELDELRESARKFAKELRESGAAEAMTEAENGLSEFSGTRGHEGAKEAADILEDFIQKCKSCGKEGGCKACRKRFQPKLAESMCNTLGQLAGKRPGEGDGPGSGFGAGGSGGYSTRRGNENVGLYGDSPLVDRSQSSGMGESTRQTRDRPGREAGGRRGANDDEGAHDAAGPLRAAGGTDAAVPLRYRRQVGRYFQRIADELGDK